MADDGSIFATGAAGRLGAVGRTVIGLLLERGLPVRAMVRREDDRAAALRAAGAEVVAAPLGLRAPRSLGIARFFPDPEALLRSYSAINEILGEPVRAFLVAAHLRRQAGDATPP